ncbi:WD40 [Musa troglodytarum]|uniref:WD40 n=1 Tax=Musa troglodytarum TaxID=320322 RepID=A0A9E7FH81_9LILI|nr:WD40 [Musa troglodytarum]
MASHWQAVPLVASPSYPNSIAWSNENLVAVASGHIVTIVNPALLDGPRGLITLSPNKPFPIGVVQREDLLTPCLMPTCLSRDTRPCVRSISWSQPGFASNSGCLLAVCTSEGRIKLYRAPFCEFRAEWVEVVDISDLLFNYFERTNFGEKSLLSTSFAQKETSASSKSSKKRVIESQDCSSSKEPTFKRNVVSRRSKGINHRKSLGEAVNNGANGEDSHEDGWHDSDDDLMELSVTDKPVAASTESIVRPCSIINQVFSEEVIEVSSDNAMVSKQISPIPEGLLPEGRQNYVPMITPEQYASRSALLSALVGVWSPVLQSSRIQPGFSNRYTILAVGGKSGKISLWKLCEPERYTIEHGRVSVDPMLVGLIQAHNSWITAISWEMLARPTMSQLILATGSSDGSVKIWAADVEDLAGSSEANKISFSLINELTAAMPAPISTISLVVPRHSQENIVLAIGKGSGSLEAWICNVFGKKIHSAGVYDAHDQVVTGLAWAFGGGCLYSCSQDNSVQSWVLHGDYLHKVTFPSKFPGFRNSTNLSLVSDQCFGLALSPGGLTIAVVRSFDVNLLHQMYQARTQKAVIEFFWAGGQSLEISPDNTGESALALSERDLSCWESNILWSLQYFEDAENPLVPWDSVAALLEFKKSSPSFVENLLFKWISGWFSCHLSDDSIDKMLPHVVSMLSEISSRKIFLLNIICRRLMMSDAKGDMHNGEELKSSDPKNEGKFAPWSDMLVSNELELQQRAVLFAFRAVLSHASRSSDVFAVGKKWFPVGVAQMECWVLLNAGPAHSQLNVLGSELRGLGSRISSICEYVKEETCSFCSAPVPFESADVAWCEGHKLDSSGSKERHRLSRCAASMRLCSVAAPMWFCMCCHRSAMDTMPKAFFTMSKPPLGTDDDETKLDFCRPLCPFCGILLQRSMPEFLLSPSPV